jgi:hypothetical protein
MDHTRLNTAQLFVAGILNREAQQTAIPRDRETFDGHDAGYHYAGAEVVIAALEAGKLVEASNYYGIPSLWKVADGQYRGILMQYRSVTEDERFNSAESAEAWFRDMYYATDG